MSTLSSSIAYKCRKRRSAGWLRYRNSRFMLDQRSEGETKTRRVVESSLIGNLATENRMVLLGLEDGST
jgi:hypothetical protein